MKLKPIPQNTVVHTPTEEESKELLAILHENGYTWYAAPTKEDGWNNFKDETCYRINSHDNVYHTCDREWYETTCKYCRLPILTLAEFKERYCEMTEQLTGKPEESSVIPDDAKDDSMNDTKELNLCELLKGHEGEKCFLTTMGDVIIDKVSAFSVQFKKHETAKGIYSLPSSGKVSENGLVIAHPSRELYERYPLDPKKAWSVWQEEQERSIRIKVEKVESGYIEIYQNRYFRTPTNRDKCIEEIKAIIEKYSK